MSSDFGQAQQGHDRIRSVRVFRDPRTDPPSMVDEELPTKTVKLNIGPLRAHRGTVEKTYRITGSWRQLSAPGTYSLRITRINAYVGSVAPTPGSQPGFYIRHSREGTVFSHNWSRLNPYPVALLGGPLTPVISVGPGTLMYAFRTNVGSAYDKGLHIEGHAG